MRFSILLPTRNRLGYLKLAIESVLRQDFDDWQLVVSDNSSDDDIEGYATQLNDRRIVYRRTERPVPVTENWNRALAYSTGEYVVMLGDDDALLDGYLRRMDELIDEFRKPDVIYSKALLFTYPGVHPAHPAGYLMDYGCADFFNDCSLPFVLDRERALDLVRAAMSFRAKYDYNAQFALISRRLIESLQEYGDFYQSAFPDFYSMNAAFLRSRSIVIEPAARIIIGVTPKSYGYFHLNEKETEGRSFLDGPGSAAIVGTNINIGWLSAATALEKGVGADFGMRADMRRYRLVQAAYFYPRYRAGLGDRTELLSMEREFPFLERWLYRCAHAAVALFGRLIPVRLKVAVHGRRMGQLPVRTSVTWSEGRFRDVLEVYDAQAERSLDRIPSARI